MMRALHVSALTWLSSPRPATSSLLPGPLKRDVVPAKAVTYQQRACKVALPVLGSCLEEVAHIMDVGSKDLDAVLHAGIQACSSCDAVLRK